MKFPCVCVCAPYIYVALYPVVDRVWRPPRGRSLLYFWEKWSFRVSRQSAGAGGKSNDNRVTARALYFPGTFLSFPTAFPTILIRTNLLYIYTRTMLTLELFVIYSKPPICMYKREKQAESPVSRSRPLLRAHRLNTWARSLSLSLAESSPCSGCRATPLPRDGGRRRRFTLYLSLDAWLIARGDKIER